MKILVITEKPSSARKIAEALSGGRDRKLGRKVAYYEFERGGEKITVAPAVGHLYSLKQEQGGSGYPVFDIKWVPASEVSKGAGYTKDYLAPLQKLAKDADEVVSACDYDIEGSTIGGNIIRFNAKGKNASRMKFSTLTKEELVDAFERRGALDEENIEAGEARHFLDWMWGINNSRALMHAIKSAGIFRVMSIGRVQGPALALLAKREKEIAAFVSRPFWQLFAFLQAAKFTHVKDKFFDEKEADQALANSDNRGVVKSVESRKVKQAPPAPFDLTTLQTEAYRCFGVSPTETLAIAQTLYENALISYPRTASQKLPARLSLAKIIEKISQQPAYKAKAGELMAAKRFVPHEGVKEDPAHPAIHPTGEKPSKLGPVQQKVYDLIVKRFLTCFAPEAKIIRMNVVITFGSEDYRAEGVHTVEQGWRSFYVPYANIEDVPLPPLETGQKIEAEKIEKVRKETQPPKRFTPASVIKKLETENVGTKATRAAIVQTLFDRGYLTGKSITVTPLGLAVVSALEKNVPDILSVELTRRFEDEMEAIQAGKESKSKVVGEGRKELEKILEKFKGKEESVGKELVAAFKDTQSQANELGPCKCGKGKLVIRKSKYGLFVGCSDYPNCRQTYPLPHQALVKSADRVCEKCGTPVVKIIRKGRRPFEMCLDTNCETKKNWGNNSGAKRNENRS